MDGVPISIETTTWRQNWGAMMGWAPYRIYRARSKDAVFTNRTGPTPPWRIPPIGGCATRSWYATVSAISSNGRMKRIALRRGSLTTVEDSRWRSSRMRRAARLYIRDFEPYEAVTPWTLGGSEAKLRAAIETGDAHTGSNALRLHGTDVLAAVANIPAPGGRLFVLGYWYKTRAGDGGRWTISANGMELATRTIDDTEAPGSSLICRPSCPKANCRWTWRCD